MPERVRPEMLGSFEVGWGRTRMPQGNPLGLIAGLAFVVVFIATIATFNRVTVLVQAPIATTSGYELAGSSRPAK